MRRDTRTLENMIMRRRIADLESTVTSLRMVLDLKQEELDHTRAAHNEYVHRLNKQLELIGGNPSRGVH